MSRCLFLSLAATLLLATPAVHGAEVYQWKDANGVTHYSKDYQALFNLFLKHRDKIDRVTFWGVHDGQSWLNGWPVPGRTNYPLLFDRNFQPKPAFHRVVETKTKSQSAKKAF
ncbi:MAG: endo-1,4-beta-xylanase [Chitinophagaceae bacterium]|nr:endo-1,4-beta-xylanase [Chitinophagaceae bacterium]